MLLQSFHLEAIGQQAPDVGDGLFPGKGQDLCQGGSERQRAIPGEGSSESCRHPTLLAVGAISV